MIAADPKKIYFLGIFAMAFGLFGCSSTVLEYRDVQGFSCVTEVRDSGTQLRLQGLAFHSALAVKELKTNIEGNTMAVEVFLTPARKGLSGRFDYMLDIPDSVEQVVFGKRRHLIWERTDSYPAN